MVRSCESLRRGTFAGGGAAAGTAGAAGFREPVVRCGVEVPAPEVAGAVSAGRFACGGRSGGFGPKYLAQARMTPMESSDATRMRNSGVNLSFCPGTFKSAPHGESLWDETEFLRRKLRERDRSQTSARADGSAAAASIRAKRRAARRNAQSPGKHTASRWDQTGNSPQTEKTNTFCKNLAPAAQRARAGLAEQTLVCLLFFANESSLCFHFPASAPLRSSRSKSVVSVANGALATALFG